MLVREILTENLEEDWKKKTAAIAAAGVLAGVPLTKYMLDKYKTVEPISTVSSIEDQGEHVGSSKFYKKLKEISDNLSINPNDLLRVIHLETAGTYDPSISNQIGATGLIQFMPRVAHALGTSTRELAAMTATEQLDFVYRYFKMNKLPPNSSASDIYLMTFMPFVIRHNKPDNYILGARGAYNARVFPNLLSSKLTRGSLWDQNPVFHEDPEIKKRGYFTVGDVRNTFERKTQQLSQQTR